MILFSYRHSIKARWKDENGHRVIRWLCGSAHGECWRQSLLLKSHKVVYIPEGETDALTLLSIGVERPGESLVLALASAEILPKTEPFRDKTIIIVPDPDDPGVKAAIKLKTRLEEAVADVFIIPISEITNG